MNYGKNIERHIPKCLECGDKIRYGRTDKKFCCDECKNRHYNNLAKGSRTFRRKVLAMLSGNYEVLNEVLRSGSSSIDLMDAVAMGFAPGVMTSFRKSGKHDEFGCFDIRYIMTRTRIYSISKIQNVYLPLHSGTKKE
ncbi:MAG: hypothetical protein K1V99_12570 [Bacteroidales bacterium]|nr:hypothetical protein [Bacteroidales bacterium]